MSVRADWCELPDLHANYLPDACGDIFSYDETGRHIPILVITLGAPPLSAPDQPTSNSWMNAEAS